MTDLIGQTIDRYQILEQLGQGGMATVYLAYDLRLDRKVAVKVIRRDVFPPVVLDRVLKRFEREAKALAKLKHANIVAIIDFGMYDGSPYLVMPYIPSGTLKDKLGKPIQYNQAAQILAPIARSLAYAHEEEIIHRDVKPANILITQSGDPVLTDFGVAKLLEEVDGNTLTGTGMGLGIPEYMAPEQWQGKADSRSDQYALGVIFYEMVTGQRPYTADTPIAIMLKQLNEPLPNLRKFSADVPQQVELNIMKMMAKDPENRYPDMSAVARMLEKAASQQLPIREQTGYFEDISDQEDEQTRYDQTSSQAYVQAGKSVIESVRLKSVPSSDQTFDQVESLKANPESEVGKLVNPGGTNISVPEKKFKGSKVGKKWSLAFIGILVVGFGLTLISLLSSNQSSKNSPISTDTAQVSVAETSIPTDTTQLTKTSIITPAPTQVGNSTPTLEISSTMISENDGMEMVYVPAGSFLMGCPLRITEEYCSPDTLPRHAVYLDAYFIDKTEVTNFQYKLCMEANACSYPSNYSFLDSPSYIEHPVIYVTWEQAKNYCQWAGRDLPSEEQWEKAARGTDQRTFPWGKDGLEDDGFYPDIISIYANIGQGNNYLFGDTTAVGIFTKGASPYGALDMAGNVWEWVADWYGDYPSGLVSNPTGPSFGEYHVIRGGSWRAPSLVSYHRASDYWYDNYIGFRCVTSP